MSDTNSASKTNLQKAFILSGAFTLASLGLGYLIYSKFYKDRAEDLSSESCGEDYILDKSLSKTNRTHRKG